MTAPLISPALQEFLAEMASEFPVRGSWPGTDNNTLDFLLHLYHKKESALTKEEIRALDQLCRKVDVFKNVWASYDHEWKRSTHKIPLPYAAWLLLGAIFLDRARSLASEEGDARGRAMKWMNSVFNLIELRRDNEEDSRIDVLLQLAELELQRVTSL
ncbi:hypothetical protein ACFLQ0_02285 [Nitrospinota bacterium]